MTYKPKLLSEVLTKEEIAQAKRPAEIDDFLIVERYFWSWRFWKHLGIFSVMLLIIQIAIVLTK